MKMKRDLEKLREEEHDLLIIGGGILGLFIAWDAALRGLNTALIDKGDFGGETSSNSLRIIHGGLRHIQSLNIRAAGRFKREQRIFMNLAPGIVKPMPVIIPLYGQSSLIKYSLEAAFKIYDFLGAGMGPSENGNRGKFENRFLTSEQCIEMLPGINKENLSGGFIFTDCQIKDSERFNLLIASLAFKEGAKLANYVEAIELILEDNRVKGTKVKDKISGEEFVVRSRFIVNSAGPWINTLLPNRGNEHGSKLSGNLRAFNVALSKDLTNGYALGLKSTIDDPYMTALFSRGSRYLFITPWKGKSLIGTQYLKADSGPDDIDISRDDISAFLDVINTYHPQAKLSYDDVEYVYRGYVPTHTLKDGKERIGIKDLIYDHQKEQGISGILSARGSKYTDARIVAEECVDLVLKKTGEPVRPSVTKTASAYSDSSSEFQHGSEGVSVKTKDLSTQVINAVKNEMALKLSDVVFRRLDLNYDDIKQNLEQYSGIMAKELNWDSSRIETEQKEVISRLSIPN